MKRAALLSSILVSILVQAAFPSEHAYSTLVPRTAKSMAMGGAFATVPTSEFSFFGNPAFFAANKSTFALPTIDAWSYGRPSDGLGKLPEILGAFGGKDFVSSAFGILAEDGGSGGGASIGLTLAGRGVGLGLFMTNDSSIEGHGDADRTVRSDTETSLVLGMGFPFDLGSSRLLLGADLRPFYRVSLRDKDGGDPTLAEVVDAGSDALYADAFFGATLDLGASLSFGSLALGMSIRDLAPTYPIATGKLSKLQSAFSSGNLPDTSSATDRARFRPIISAGVSWSPAIAPGALDPAFYLEAQDIIGAAWNWEGSASLLELMHAGLELRVYKVLSLRGGLNRGRISAGGGVRLFFLDLNAAVFTEELGALPGDDSRSGLSLQAAIRL